MVLNKISAWSKFSRKSRGPSAPRRVLLPSAVFGGASLLWLNKAIGSVWSPVNSLLGFHSPLLALYSHEITSFVSIMGKKQLPKKLFQILTMEIMRSWAYLL